MMQSFDASCDGFFGTIANIILGPAPKPIDTPEHRKLVARRRPS